MRSELNNKSFNIFKKYYFVFFFTELTFFPLYVIHPFRVLFGECKILSN